MKQIAVLLSINKLTLCMHVCHNIHIFKALHEE